MAGDPRWRRKQIILTTLILQLCFSGIVMAMGLHGFLENYHLYFPVPVSCFTALNALVSLFCFFSSSLHPLVVLTLSIEFMLLWLGVVAYSAYFYLRGMERCGASGIPPSYWEKDYDYDFKSERAGYGINVYGVTKQDICQRTTVSLVFSVLSLVSYIFLVAYSAARRKRTAMPYIVPKKVSRLSIAAAYNPDTYRTSTISNSPHLPVQPQQMVQTTPQTTTATAPQTAPTLVENYTVPSRTTSAVV